MNILNLLHFDRNSGNGKTSFHMKTMNGISKNVYLLSAFYITLLTPIVTFCFIVN